MSQTAILFKLLITVFGGNFRNECLFLLYLNYIVFLQTKLFFFLSEIAEKVIMALLFLEIEG